MEQYKIYFSESEYKIVNSTLEKLIEPNGQFVKVQSESDEKEIFINMLQVRFFSLYDEESDGQHADVG